MTAMFIVTADGSGSSSSDDDDDNDNNNNNNNEVDVNVNNDNNTERCSAATLRHSATKSETKPAEGCAGEVGKEG